MISGNHFDVVRLGWTNQKLVKKASWVRKDRLFQHPLQIQFGHLNQTIALNFTQKILALTNSALQKRYKMLTDLFFFVSDSPELAKHGGFQALVHWKQWCRLLRKTHNVH